VGAGLDRGDFHRADAHARQAADVVVEARAIIPGALDMREQQLAGSGKAQAARQAVE
jgi:hypothetical protein